MKIDIHSHFIPDGLADYVREHGDSLNAYAEAKDDGDYIGMKGAAAFPVWKTFYDMDARITDLDKRGLEKEILSISPLYFFYDADDNAALGVCRYCNDWVYDFAQKASDRFGCMAMVPMQNIGLAIDELSRVHTEKDMNAVEIAPVIRGKMLDAPEFFPFYEYCEKEEILIYLHPARVGNMSPYDKFHGMNLMGYVEETNWALVRMIFGGVFQRFPKLKVLSSHGGGNFPYQYGRLLHGFEVRAEAKEFISSPPSEYVKNIYFDTITHWKPSLQFLVDNFGADHVLMGTDYPYDMADFDPVGSVNALRLTAEEREAVLGENCRNLLKMQYKKGRQTWQTLKKS